MATLIWFLLIFSVVVVSHEFGHFIIAKANGIHVVEFYVGFGPTLFHFTKGGTKYSLKLLPLGGACVFEGMDALAEELEKDLEQKKSIREKAKLEGSEGGLVISGTEASFENGSQDVSGVEASFENGSQDVSRGEVSFENGSRVVSRGEASFENGSQDVSGKEVLAQNKKSTTTHIEASYGATNSVDQQDEETGIGSFLNAGVWSRFATVLAGPLFNIILGFIIAFIMVNLIVVREPVASIVVDSSPAMEAGLMDGDRIVSMNGTRIDIYDDIALFNAMFQGGDIELVYERDGQQYHTTVTPVFDESYGRYMLGISNDEAKALHGLESLKYTWYEVRYNFRMTIGSLKLLLRGKVKSEDVSGPVGIAVNVVGATYEQTKEYGWDTVLVNMMNIALMLTINLGILNLLPIPALDGGRLLFIIIEIVVGKPVPPKKEALVHMAGMILLMALVVFVFFNDLKNVFF